jgi:hypothetical protein
MIAFSKAKVIVVNLVFCIHPTITLTASFPILDNGYELTSHACEEISNFICRCSCKTINSSITAIYLQQKISMAS